MNVRISSKDNQSLAQENAALQNEVNILKEQLALLQEQFDWLKKQVFGRKTEQTSVIMDGSTQLSLFPDEKEQAVSVHEKTVTVPEHQRKARRTHDAWMKKLPIVEIVHKEENPVCDIRGSPMNVIGKVKLYDELVYQPAQVYVRRHYAENYMCTNCVQDSENEADSYEIEKCYIRCADYPDCSLADLYNETTMPPELRKAHQKNDFAVMAAYNFDRKMTESECVGELMRLYQELTAPG